MKGETAMKRESAYKYLYRVYSNTKTDGLQEALAVALSALRPVTRERVEKAWRSEWVNTNKEVEQICKCSKCSYPISYFWSRTPFCPNCGAPMTDEAVGLVLERLEALYEG